MFKAASVGSTVILEGFIHMLFEIIVDAPVSFIFNSSIEASNYVSIE